MRLSDFCFLRVNTLKYTLSTAPTIPSKWRDLLHLCCSISSERLIWHGWSDSLSSSSSVAALTDCMRSKTLATFFRDRQAALKRCLPLGSYLLKPVQRILKYHLLLQVPNVFRSHFVTQFENKRFLVFYKIKQQSSLKKIDLNIHPSLCGEEPNWLPVGLPCQKL